MNKTLVAFIIASVFSTCCAQISPHTSEQTISKSQQPLSVSGYSDEKILNWANKHIIDVYTFYFEDIDKWRIDIKPYFSTQGYTDFLNFMEKSKTLDKVKRKKLIVQPKIDGNAIVALKGVNKGTLNDIYTWYVIIPIEITYLGPNEKTKHHLLVKLEIMRQNNAGNKDYIAINSLEVYPNDKTEKAMTQVMKIIKEKATLENSRMSD